MKPSLKTSVLVAVLGNVLAGCSAWQRIDATVTQAQSQAAQASEALRTVNAPVAPHPVVSFSDQGLWVDTTPIPLAKKETPSALDWPVTFIPAGEMSLMEFAQWMTTDTGMPIRVTPDALAALNGTLAKQEDSSTSSNASNSNSAMQRVSGNRDAQNTGRDTPRQDTIRDLKWVKKPMRGLLDVVTVKMGLSWRHDERGITIYYLDTQNFPFWGVQTTTSTESVISSGANSTTGTSTSGSSSSSSSASSVGGTANSSQNTSVTTKIAIVEDVEKSLKAMLTPKVGRLAMSASTGTITITDTPEVLAKVGKFIASENRRITRQVRVNVKVLSVSLSNKDSLGVDWGLVYNSLSKNYGFGLSTSLANTVSGMSGTFTLSNSSTSKFAGSDAVVKALAEQGNVATLASPSVVTMNMRAVPVQFTKQTTYFGGKQSTTTGTSGTTTNSDIIGTVTTGFNMRVLPVLMTGDELQLQFDLNMGALDQLRAIANGGEAPEISNQIVSQAVKLKSGQTLIVSGFEQRVDQANKSGVGHPDNVLFGLHKTDNKDDRIVMMVTPVIED